jgi:hypothetical protein
MYITRKMPMDKNIAKRFNLDEITVYIVAKAFFLGSNVFCIQIIPRNKDMIMKNITNEKLVSINETIRNKACDTNKTLKSFSS